MNITQPCRKCGLVRLAGMKIHIVLQALSSTQAYISDLRIYVKDSSNGTREAWNMEVLLPMK